MSDFAACSLGSYNHCAELLRLLVDRSAIPVMSNTQELRLRPRYGAGMELILLQTSLAAGQAGSVTATEALVVSTVMGWGQGREGEGAQISPY